MNTTINSLPTTAPHRTSNDPRSPLRRCFGVVARPQSYRNIAYLLLGLALGTVWFTALVTGLAVGASLLVVALLGIPVLWGMWYVVRAFANVERRVAGVLLGGHIPSARLASGHRGNVWVRLRALTRERDRWRELGFLVARFPAGVATFVVAVVALAVPLTVAYVPFAARFVDDSFGDWFWSAELHDFASRSPWSWLLVPLGLVMLVGSFHGLNALAAACGRWTTRSLRIDRRTPAPAPVAAGPA